MTKENSGTVKAGSLLSIESGEYSDYEVHGFFVALKGFSPKSIMSKFLMLFPDQKTGGGISNQKFLAYLIDTGHLLEIQYNTLHVSDHGNQEEMEFRQRITDD